MHPFSTDSYGEAALSIIKAHWDSNAQDSCYVFTSSGGVYSENSGGIVNEESSVKDTDYVKGMLITWIKIDNF